MKNLLLIFAFVFAAFVVKAQDEVPADVHAKFTEKYPQVNTEDVNWQSEDFYYQAEFEENDMKHEVRIDRKGNLISAESELAPENVPTEVKDGIKQEFGEVEMSKARMLETPESTMYKLEVDAEGETFDVYTDKKGKIIEREDS